ncbi:MAG: bifunctional fucokinase/L-fucose-1-P-guanylyltransferase, partial [Bacteroidaceae bacterium]|nr:bifunctional fucokinase/L-fucose-1-P-guanylyltransferase [Bacteroidaceae bacterium]
MKKLLSLPPNLVSCFHEVEEVSHDEYFCTCDPVGTKLGSGGGTNWLLQACYEHETAEAESFLQWLGRERRILLHAGGQSRRLPGYAPSGKVLTPIPIFRWQRGQRISQNLLQLQLPLYEQIMKRAPEQLHTLVASGDVYIRARKLQPIPDADVVCYGLWVDAQLAKNHGVFLLRRDCQQQLDFMLQKPSVERLGSLMQTHFCLMDIGIWLLSDRAVERLRQRSSDGRQITSYDLYSDFGCALGHHPSQPDPLLADLSVAILPLEDGAFYHYGTNREMISSTVAVQNLVFDQRAIMKMGTKPHPSIFLQNAHCELKFTASNENTWVENAWIGEGWQLTRNNIVTGVPCNNWKLRLAENVCLDVVPIGDRQFALRPYGFNDAFRGPLTDSNVSFLGQPVTEWLAQRRLTADDFTGADDLQSATIFPLFTDLADMERVLRWMTSDPSDADARELYLSAERLSANELSDHANLLRLKAQRMNFLKENLSELAANHRNSIFYQANLADLAQRFHQLGVALPQELEETEPLMKRISDQFFRSQLLELNGHDGAAHRQRGYLLLGQGLTADTLTEH